MRKEFEFEGAALSEESMKNVKEDCFTQRRLENSSLIRQKLLGEK